MMNPAEFANIAAAERDFWWYRGMRRILSAMVEPLARKRHIRTVLEAGCGTGYNAAELQKRYGWRVFPFDLQMGGLAYAKATGLQRLTQGDIVALPFRSGTFDAVFCLDVMVHLPPGLELRALAELSRVLAPGGLLILRVAALNFLRSRHSEFVCERQRFRAKSFAPAVAQQGIRVLRCTYANMLLFPIALLKFRLWEPLTLHTPKSGVHPLPPWLNRLLMLPLIAESRWLTTDRDIPLGQSLLLIGEKRRPPDSLTP
jgi:SAM-dependent methyltransferase